jgi:DNA-binding NtrC family response regulator
MNPAVAMKLEASIVNKSSENHQQSSGRPKILIAAADPEIRTGLAEILKAFHVDTIWVNGVEAAKRMLGTQKVAACLCGFWLQDGTYRELIRHMRRESLGVSVIIVSAPACPNEYRDYLAALNIGALDFLCHPYQSYDLARMLETAITSHVRSIDENRSDNVSAEQQPAIQELRERGAA